MMSSFSWWAAASFVLLTVGCNAEDDVGEQAAAVTPVTWTDLVGVSAAVGNLTKTAPETAWNAGAVSVQTLAGDGFVEFTSAESTTDKAIGLSVGNGSAKMSDIDFCVRLKANGAAMVYESGVALVSIGSYAPGVVFRVQAEDGVVTYWRNGVLKYTSAIAPTFPLLVDTSLRTPGASLTDVRIEPIDFWTDAVGVSVDGRDITKTAPEDQFNAGAASLGTISSGDGYVEFRVADNTSLKVAGLSHGNGGTSRNDIDFAISLQANGAVQVYEAGSFIGAFDGYTASNVFRVQVSGGIVSYFQNRVPFYTSSVAPTYPLGLDSAIKTPGASILGGKVVAGPVTDECSPLEDILPAPGVGAIAAAGDVLVVGQRTATPPVATVYRWVDGVWTLEQTLANPAPGASFAYRVDTDGQTIAVSVGTLADQRGYVQLYRHDGVEWVDDGTLEGCSRDLEEFAVRGDILVAGVGLSDLAHVFRRVNGSWQLDAILTEPTAYSFGDRVAIGGGRIFVAGYPASGVFVFRYNPALPDPSAPPSCSNLDGGKWRRSAAFMSTPGHEFGYTGIGVDAAGKRLLAGDWLGDVHLFQLAGGVWSETVLESYPEGFIGRSSAFGGPGGDSVAVIDGWLFAELEDGWTQIDYADEGALDVAWSSETVLRADPFDEVVRVYGLDPVCLAE